jgi:hypothetical protein
MDLNAIKSKLNSLQQQQTKEVEQTKTFFGNQVLVNK